MHQTIKPNSKRMTRSRGAKGNARNTLTIIPKQLTDKTYVVMRSTAHTTLVNAGFPWDGANTILHPYYGINNIAGSVDNSWGLGSLQGSSSTEGFLINTLFLKAKIKFSLANLEAFEVVVNFLPTPNSAKSLLGANYNSPLETRPKCISVHLSKAGVTGSVKEVTFEIDIPELEGFSRTQFESNSLYYGTATSIGTNYSSYYIQNFGWQLPNQVLGVSCRLTTEFFVKLIQSNVLLNE